MLSNFFGKAVDKLEFYYNNINRDEKSDRTESAVVEF